MPTTFTEATRALLDGKNVAVLATLNPGGEPQTSVIWVMRDGDTVLFTTTAQRQKGRNLARDSRVSMTIIDSTNPYNTVEIRGHVKLTEDPEHVLGRTLSQKYLGEDPPPDPPGTTRLIVRVHPEKVAGFSA